MRIYILEVYAARQDAFQGSSRSSYERSPLFSVFSSVVLTNFGSAIGRSFSWDVIKLFNLIVWL